MRENIETGLAWATIALVVLSVWLGRRRGRQNRENAVAAARAEGKAEALAAVTAAQSVTVAVDASRRSGLGAEAEHWCVEPWDCAVCGPVLRRVAGQRGPGIAAYDGPPAELHYAADNGAGEHGTPYVIDTARVRGVPVERRTVSSAERGDFGRGAGG